MDFRRWYELGNYGIGAGFERGDDEGFDQIDVLATTASQAL